MANADAFNQGFDAGMSKTDQKKKKPGKDTNTNSGPVSQPGYDWSSRYEKPVAGTMHKGGTVKKTGNYRLKKGEKVLTIAQQKAVGLKTGKKKPTGKKRVASKR